MLGKIKAAIDNSPGKPARIVVSKKNVSAIRGRDALCLRFKTENDNGDTCGSFRSVRKLQTGILVYSRLQTGSF
ncbi:hypothetical protein BSI_17630 [Bacillus inaquosorum KCTC 13429]|uniref:Uncharacterized protein n=1 Tax=Bacillus inaquosorum KCTC 13429 TaxID=1236548 RepID=A0A9W5LIK6_9BACI|nr:hypothetical protein BSI_17630 [Bacillus inaquosorum KCTC 13429]